MPFDKIETLLKIIESGITVLAIIVAGFCTYFKFFRNRENSYTHVARVSSKAEVLMLHSYFKYLDDKRSHTAETTVKISHS